ncbi:MAG: 2'-5' RNA ligase family protein [Sphingomonas sp.]|nr:2'-5' RNA ligase family protein [Sphingomonas sp.]
MARPLIVTALMGAADQAQFDRLRTTYFPPERNQLDAHLTIFHAIPYMLEEELRHRLAALAAELPTPRATVSGLMNLGGGVAYRITSDDLEAIRNDLGAAFRGHLTQQDSHGWRPHVTVQNKVTSSTALATLTDLEPGFVPRGLGITGLAYYHYEGGPWRLGRRYPFRGAR